MPDVIQTLQFIIVENRENIKEFDEEISGDVDRSCKGRYNSKKPYGGSVMKYMKQIALIILFSFLGEVCRALIPLPIPASIYGMVLMFGALALKIVKLEQVKDAGGFMTSILPVLFVAPLVSLMDCWPLLRENLLPLAVIATVTTVTTFGAAGLVTKWMMGGKKHE